MYKGTAYQGWQKQPHTTLTIQQQIADAIQLVTREAVEVVGCGRTDSGVHAEEYVFHIDTDYADISTLLYKINQITKDDIYCKRWSLVQEDAHARYSAIKRGYTYYLSKERNPFSLETAYTYINWSELDISIMNEVARLLLGTHTFTAFCKSGTDVKTKVCTLVTSEWKSTDAGMEYTVRGNRYLRGMIRLIVGMCINVSRKKLSLDQVKMALQHEARLPLDWSVPAHGLFLDLVEYPEELYQH